MGRPLREELFFGGFPFDKGRSFVLLLNDRVFVAFAGRLLNKYYGVVGC